MNKYFTYDEIYSQSESWEKNYEKIMNEKFDLGTKIFNKQYDKIILYGCGSSYNLALSASFFTSSLLKQNAFAIPSSELIFNNDIYMNKNEKHLLIGFSRSGETTESIDVVKNIKGNKNIDSMVFTCRENSTFANISEWNFCCVGAEESSVAMTKSFSSMLFAYCLILAKFIGNKEKINGFSKITEYIKKNISNLLDSINKYADHNDFDKFFALGSGFNYGLAVEADLKVKEITQVPSYSYHVTEFNHGPKSLISEGSLCLFLTPNSYLKKIDFMIENLIDLGSKIMVIGKNNISKRINGDITYIFSDETFDDDIIRSFINIPVFQALALFKAIKLGLNPDKPRNLDYTVKIYNEDI